MLQLQLQIRMKLMVLRLLLIFSITNNSANDANNANNANNNANNANYSAYWPVLTVRFVDPGSAGSVPLVPGYSVPYGNRSFHENWGEGDPTPRRWGLFSQGVPRTPTAYEPPGPHRHTSSLAPTSILVAWPPPFFCR